MRTIKEIKQFCSVCMKIHLMKIVEITEIELYENHLVKFESEYSYCEIYDMLVETEDQIRNNFKSMKKGIPVNQG